MAKLKKNSHLILYRKYSANLKFIMMAICVMIITLFLPKQARFKFEYEKGKTWMQNDLLSPYTFAIQKTNAEIEKDREDVLQSVLPVYQNNIDVVKKELEAFNTDL